MKFNLSLYRVPGNTYDVTHGSRLVRPTRHDSLLHHRTSTEEEYTCHRLLRTGTDWMNSLRRRCARQVTSRSARGMRK